jgi:hypothetical protein
MVDRLRGVYGLRPCQPYEWAVSETFGWHSLLDDRPQPATLLRRWLEEEGFADIEVVLAGHLVGRGRKPR